MKMPRRKFVGAICQWTGVVLIVVVLFVRMRSHFPTGARPRRASGGASASAGTHVPRTVPDGLLTAGVIRPGRHYRLWVWAVSPSARRGKRIKVEIAHAASGKDGGFWIVAYADTDGDKEPDTEIARSDFLTASRAAAWSSCEFESEHERVFVGNTWPEDADTLLYRDSGPWPQDTCPLGARFYHVVRPDHVKTAGPARTNLRISFPTATP